MRLSKFSYKLVNFPGIDDWMIDDVYLQELNLIVGKNSVGKSRALNILSSFAEMVTQDEPVFAGEWKFYFVNNNHKEILYFINTRSREVVEEKLSIDGKLMLERNHEVTRLYSNTKEKFEDIDPPDDKLVLHARRDKKEYPFLEDIVIWAQNTYTFKFGQINPKAFLSVDSQGRRLVTLEDIPSVIGELSDKSVSDVVRDFNELGYCIEKFYSKLEGRKDILYVKEKGLKHELRQHLLSQGMFRTLTLIVFIHFLVDKGNVQTIIVDDFCEGLDYERATILGKLVFEMLAKHNIQLIASSNDSFLMDVVNIRNWNVLERQLSVVKVHNYINSEEKFSDFKYSGLSNFDLFASDYLD